MSKSRANRLRANQGRRRELLKYLTGVPMFGLSAASRSAPIAFAAVNEGATLHFPRDHGAHADYRTEWWYLTGWLDTDKQPLGFQVTFFRSRTIHSPENPSRFAPGQLLFAHVAVADPQSQRLEHDQRSARAGFGYASFSENTTDVRIGGWRLWQTDEHRYQCVVRSKLFSLQLTLQATQPIWLQGNNGFSRKGPRPPQASHYYSRPQLAVSAELQWSQRSVGASNSPARRLGGVAWLDHEWSSQVLDPQASGWDWLGLNLSNGDALMAFRIRPALNAEQNVERSKPIWQHARIRRADQSIQDFSDSVEFSPRRGWRSTRTGVNYPVEMTIRIGNRTLTLLPLFDDQELDSRQSTGTLYWEGAVTALEDGKPVGRGYLELTGYGDRLRL